MSGLFASLFGPPSSSSSSNPRSGGAGPGGSAGPSYSFARLQRLYDRLARFRESDLEKDGDDAVVETVRQITEALIWGEQNDAHFFDFFCEKNILADFVRVLGHPKAPKKVRLQLLQTLSILVLNIRCQTSVYYLLSNNHINRLMETPLDFEDEEILAYYITLIKSLAMRLDKETIKFFFLQHPKPTFPLYNEATKFFDNRDQMVRTTVRTITLQVYRIDDQLMRRFVLRHAAESYFSQLAYHLRDLWLRLDAAASGAREQEDLKAVQREHELQQDLLIYLSDVFEQGVEELNEVLADRLLNCAMLPLLLTGVMAVRGYDVEAEEQSRVLLPFVALFLLRQVFEIFRCPCLLAPLASALLQPTVPAALAYVLPQCPALGSASPAARLQQDFQANWLREHFFSCLQCGDDAVFLLSAAVVHGCLERSEALLPSLLNQQALAATPKDGFSLGNAAVEFLVIGPEPKVSHAKAWAEEGMDGGAAQRLAVSAIDLLDLSPEGARPEVYHCLLQALYKYDEWQLETLRVLVQILLDVFLGPVIQGNARVQSDVWRAARTAGQGAAARLQELACQARAKSGEVGDCLLDIFVEEWDLHTASGAGVAEFCGDPQRLLPASLWGSGPQHGTSGAQVPARRPKPGADGGARRAVRAFLILRRLLKELARHAALRRCPWGGVGAVEPAACGTAEPLPVAVEAPGDYREGTCIDFGAHDRRIVCGVASPKGKCTRYLLLHDFWLMLVQPDLAAPGKATVRTSWPIWEVQSLVDRGDPRTLQIFVSARCASASPGELTEGSLGCGSGATNVDTPVVLNFEDVARCHAANEHLERRRQSLRAGLLEKLAVFVSECCEGQQP